jgi:hypothetical protein
LQILYNLIGKFNWTNKLNIFFVILLRNKVHHYQIISERRWFFIDLLIDRCTVILRNLGFVKNILSKPIDCGGVMIYASQHLFSILYVYPRDMKINTCFQQKNIWLIHTVEISDKRNSFNIIVRIFALKKLKHFFNGLHGLCILRVNIQNTKQMLRGINHHPSTIYGFG